MGKVLISEKTTQYLNNQINLGNFSSIDEVVEESVKKQMILFEETQKAKFLNAILKGENDIRQGKTIKYTKTLIDELSQIGKENSLKNIPINSEVK